MFDHLPIGANSPRTVNAIIEVPQMTHNKYEYDEYLGVMKLDRVLHSPLFYPFDYGFIPATRSEDGDHLDIMVITNVPVFTGCLLEARPIGVMYMRDEHGLDEKILAVPARNPNYDHITKLRHIAPHFIKEINHFFTEYKRLEEKDVIIDGWGNRLAAYKVIRDAQKRFAHEAKANQVSHVISKDR